MQLLIPPHLHAVPDTQTKTLAYDVILLGGGIAGLWLLNRLCGAGYNAVLFEHGDLGHGQTIASQGMIHGGVKYTLAGALSGASEAIADMPEHWRQCLAGKGEINLENTKALSDHFYMWSTESSLSKATAFLASKALRGRVDALPRSDFPPVFNAPGFQGKLYRLVDSVIDTPSLLADLAGHVRNRIFSIDWKTSRLVVDGRHIKLQIKKGDLALTLHSQQFIFSAGKGNADLLNMIGAVKPEMQLRPLQQVLVKHRHDYALYAHCIGNDSVPRITISSHRCRDGALCWYLGGQLAEKGVEKNPRELLRDAKRELESLFPWLDWRDAQWASLAVERAEPKQKNKLRPDKAFAGPAIAADKNEFANVLVAWPTKLTLSPNLATEVLQALERQGIAAGRHTSDPENLSFLPTPRLAESPWETARWHSGEELL